MTKIRIIQKLEDKVITVGQISEALWKSERTIFRYLSDFMELWPTLLAEELENEFIKPFIVSYTVTLLPSTSSSPFLIWYSFLSYRIVPSYFIFL